MNLGIKGNNRNRYGVRGQLLFEPSSDFKIRLIGDYDRIDEICCTVANLVDGPTGAAVRGVLGQVNSNQRYSYNSYANFPSVTKIDNYGFSGQIDYAVTPQLALTSISSYRRVKTFTNADFGFHQRRPDRGELADHESRYLHPGSAASVELRRPDQLPDRRLLLQGRHQERRAADVR